MLVWSSNWLVRVGFVSSTGLQIPSGKRPQLSTLGSHGISNIENNNKERKVARGCDLPRVTENKRLEQ